MKEKTKRNRIKLGNIYEIPLPNGENAYGRLFREYVLAVYPQRGKDFSQISVEEPYQFFCGVYRDLLLDGVWRVVANIPFASDDEAWAPPMCVVDAITGKGSLYYQGEIKPCSYEECKDLEIVAAWDRNHLVDRLMGNDMWEKSMKRPQDV